MALTCTLTLNKATMGAGQTPPPLATLTVVNPNAVPVAVLGGRISFNVAGLPLTRPPYSEVLLPIDPGQNTTIAASGSTVIGPFPIQLQLPVTNYFLSVDVPGTSTPTNAQPSQPTSWSIQVGGRVQGSDGSDNAITPATITVTYINSTP
jgi:hypothetical protein